MALVPPSSFASGSVTIVGTVTTDVTDRASRLLGHVTVDNASLGVTGPMTDAEFAAHLPLVVSAPEGAATEDTLADAVSALNDVALTAILERDRMTTE